MQKPPCLRTKVERRIEKDPHDPQFGMVYEFYGPWSKRRVQGPGLDTMHDGARGGKPLNGHSQHYSNPITRDIGNMLLFHWLVAKDLQISQVACFLSWGNMKFLAPANLECYRQ